MAKDKKSGTVHSVTNHIFFFSTCGSTLGISLESVDMLIFLKQKNSFILLAL